MQYTHAYIYTYITGESLFDNLKGEIMSEQQMQQGKKYFTEILNNGCRVIARRESTNGECDVVLALTESAQPYVTWQCDVEGDCFQGHYFWGISDAVKDYEER